MKRTYIPGYFLLLLLLASCSFGEKQAVVAEILCEVNGAPADAAALKKMQQREVARVKKLLFDDELLSVSLDRSQFRRAPEEVKNELELESFSENAIIRLHYRSADTNGVTAFLDTLITQVRYFDVRPELEEAQQAVARIDRRLDSLNVVFETQAGSAASQQDAETLYTQLLQEKTNRVIEAAGFYSRIRIVSAAHPE